VTLLAEAGTGQQEKFLLIQISDHADKKEFQVLSVEDYKTLEKEVKLESFLHLKALAAAESAWRTNETKPFPESAVTPRNVQILKEFTNSEKAAEAVKAEEQKAADLLKEEAAQKAQRERGSGGRRNREFAERQKQEEQKKEALEEEREAFHKKARDLYDQKLSELITAAGGTPPDFSSSETPLPSKGKGKNVAKKRK